MAKVVWIVGMAVEVVKIQVEILVQLFVVLVPLLDPIIIITTLSQELEVIKKTKTKQKEYLITDEKNFSPFLLFSFLLFFLNNSLYQLE